MGHEKGPEPQYPSDADTSNGEGAQAFTHPRMPAAVSSARESPLVEPVRRVFGGPGSGLPCAVCHNPISTRELEYEIVELGGSDTSALQPAARVHLHCYELWCLTHEH